MFRFARQCRAGLCVAAALMAGVTLAVAEDDPIRIAFPSGMNGQVVVTMDKAGIATVSYTHLTLPTKRIV